MVCGRRFASLALAGLIGMTGAALGQQAPALRTTIDDTDSDVAADTSDTLPQAVPLPRETSLTVKPLEEPPPMIRRKAATDPYAPLGIDTGGLTLYPSIMIGGVYSSNIKQSHDDRDAAPGVLLKPSLNFASDWSRHSLTGSADLDLERYADKDKTLLRSGDADIDLRLDIRHDRRVELGLYATLDDTGLGNSEVPATAIGVRSEQIVGGRAAYIQDFGPMEGRVTAGVSYNHYDDVKLSGGGKEDNGDRNFWAPSLALRATYTDPPLLKPFAELAYVPRLYTRSHDRNGLERSSNGYSATAGVMIDDNPIWGGSLGLTYLLRDYEDPSLETTGALGLVGDVSWSPTDLTQVVMTATTSIDDSVSTASNGNRIWTLDAELTQAIRDNVDLKGGGGLEIEKQSGGNDVTYTANAGVDWKMNPQLTWSAAYDFTYLDAVTSSRSYTEHRVTAGITLQP
ncbi:outer membrane beta-barrel protein [Aestuariivirga sp.]|uniref:outer membrane beta-barrel protein n=1 Tax=Aestuariivirga sp. TaxID=2650926 RepID=UPI0039E51437